MTTARSTQIDLDVTPYYHCMSRCVRGAFLCGQDAFTGRNYEHRKEWVVQRLIQLTNVFVIDVCAYAIMSNHLHLALHVNQERLSSWTDEDIRSRVRKISPRVLKKYDEWDKDSQNAAIDLWRAHLGSLSSSLEDSSWTSIRQRILELTAKSQKPMKRNKNASKTTSATQGTTSQLRIQPQLA